MKYDGPGPIPEGYTGKAISVMECPEHGAHVNLDLILSPAEAWDGAVVLASASQDPDALVAGGVPLMIDQLSPEACEAFARDLMEAAAEARRQIAAHTAQKN